MLTKKCSECGEVKAIANFYERPERAGYTSQCRSCNSRRHRDWYERNKIKMAEGRGVVVLEQRCWVCKETKLRGDFGKSKSNIGGLNPCCKVCARERANRIYNPAARLSDPHGRKARMWFLYRLRPSEYDAMFTRQDGKCAVCEQPFTKIPRVDHCHETGVVRGLLCNSCNALLAALDKEGYLEKAMKYLATVDERTGGGA